jgi:hypothetical protein
LVADPPAFLVDLGVQISKPKTEFTERSALLEYQICTRYCTDHPYVSKAGSGVLSWTASPFCAREGDE